MVPPFKQPADPGPDSPRETCANCGYDTTPTPAGGPCPECGSLERTPPGELSYIGMHAMGPAMIVQGVGGLCCLGASIAMHLPHAADYVPASTFVLALVGLVLCLLIGPVVAAGVAYAGPSWRAKSLKNRRVAGGFAAAVATGFVAVVVGVMMGFAGCSVGWM